MKQPVVSIGGRLGRYEILGVLGRGGQSIAYKARDPKIDRIVAVKQILSTHGLPEKDRAEFLTRFMRESQAAGRLSHPNITTIYDVGGDEEGEPFIAMEYVDGGDLDQIIRQGHPLPQARVLDIFVQLCNALDYAHDAGIVHRDIKPGNIMVTRSGKVKVVDFGIARMDSSSLTQAGMVMGTPSYMSPEQVMGKPLDRRSDIFSSGVVLYEALTGERPFVGEHWTTVSFRIVNEPHDSVLSRQREPTLLPEFDAILDRALTKGPAGRYQTCAEFGLALERLLQDERLGTPRSRARLSMREDSVSVPAQTVPGDLPGALGGFTATPTPEPVHDYARGSGNDARTAVTRAGVSPGLNDASAPRADSAGEIPAGHAGARTGGERTTAPNYPAIVPPMPPHDWSFTKSRLRPAGGSASGSIPTSYPDADEADEARPIETPLSASPLLPDAKPSDTDSRAVPHTTEAPALLRETGSPSSQSGEHAAPVRRTSWIMLLAFVAALIGIVAFVALSRSPQRITPQAGIDAAKAEPAPSAAPSAVAESLTRARTALGQGLIVGRDGDDALHFVTEALALDPDNAEAKVLEADIRARALQQAEELRKQGKVNEVRLAMEVLLENFPGDAEIQAKHDTAQATSSRAKLANDLDRSRSAAEKAFATGKYSEAASLFGKLTRMDPRSASAFYFLGRSNAGRGALAEAERNLKRACELEPRNPSYAIELSRVLEKNGKLPAALASLEKGIEFGGNRENSAASLSAHAAQMRFRIGLLQLTPHTFRSKHVHRFTGRCDGQLIVNESGFSFLPDEEKAHAMKAEWAEVKRFAVLRNRLEVELSGSGKQTFECSELDRLSSIAEVVSKR